MRQFVFSLLLLLLVAPAHAQTWTLEGTGPLPTLRAITPPPPPPPPVVLPPVTPPVIDNTPFPFPASCRQNTDESARYFSLAVLPTGPIYAGLSNFGNPLPLSHTCVGMLAPGARINYGPPPDHTTLLPPDLMVWAPRATPVPYGQLRCILATGRPCP